MVQVRKENMERHLLLIHHPHQGSSVRKFENCDIARMVGITRRDPNIITPIENHCYGLVGVESIYRS